MTTESSYSKILNVVSNAVMAQVVEHILGKDEVGSSSLPNSSKKSMSFLGLGFFYPSRLAWYIISPKGLYIIAVGVYHHTKCVFLSA